MKLLKKNKGFTVVELVIVIGVIAVLSAILIPTFVNVTENAKKSARKSELASAFSAYIAEATAEQENVYTHYHADAAADDPSTPEDETADEINTHSLLSYKQVAQEKAILRYTDDILYVHDGKEWTKRDSQDASGLALVAAASYQDKYYSFTAPSTYTELENVNQESLSTFNKSVVYYDPAAL